MPTELERSGAPERRGLIRDPQGFVAGLVLVALALFALWATRNLPQGTLRAMGPAMLPRWLAIGVGMCGAALTVIAFLVDGERLQRSDYRGMLALIGIVVVAAALSAALGVSFVGIGLVLLYGVIAVLLVMAIQGNPWLDASGLRGPFFVIAGVFAFAVTIRPFALGSFTTPGLGLIVAGPLAIFIGGQATGEVRQRDLLILALALTPFCMVLFGDLLNLPIPIFHQSVAGLFPAGWSQKGVLRVTAALFAAAALLVYLADRARARRRGPDRIDVAEHTGSI